MGQKKINKVFKEFDYNYEKLTIDSDVLSNFRTECQSLVNSINLGNDQNQLEGYFVNLINSFLKRNFFVDSSYVINQSGYSDSSISFNHSVMALIEVKRVSNVSEFPSLTDINKKGLMEIIYYFLNHSKTVENGHVANNAKNEIRRLIISNGFEWFIIDGNELNRFCKGEIVELYRKYVSNQLTYSNDTSLFYNDLSQICASKHVDHSLNYLYFDITKTINNDRELEKVYKVFRKDFLLKEGFSKNIKNEILNNNFYDELLYLMGLKETKGKSSSTIKLDLSIENSLGYQIYNLLKTDKGRGEKAAVDLTFELLIIWINRILFLKLFEAQLKSFNCDSQEFNILTNEKITSFSDLRRLFFEVCGQKRRDTDDFSQRFSSIPYLNSSLFEHTECEIDNFMISSLTNSDIKVFSKSIIINKRNKKMPILKYLIDFLNSFVFGETYAGENYESTMQLIDASVLGLIFEKINGYEDGSVFTPSNITQYMAADAINNAVLSNINKKLGWNCDNIDDVKFNITSVDIAKRVNEVINEIKICDPAVGSGHFLVSALNRLIYLKYYLGVLFEHSSNNRLNYYDIYLISDELRIVDAEGKTFVYSKENSAAQKTQKTLFQEKKTIIENCLFGVDINSKAVNICRLRLWIELLKNAYYENGVMETLPNIDINIKCGNSLISRLDFRVGQKLGKQSELNEKAIKALRQYKKAVKEYKGESNKDKKRRLISAIESLKVSLISKATQMSIFDDFTEIENTSNKYYGSFEWGFEFPEIISEDGVFEGFDVLIENPPYGLINKRQNLSTSISINPAQYRLLNNLTEYAPARGQGLNIFKLFICRSMRLLKDGGECSMIFPTAFMCDLSSTGVRKYLIDNSFVWKIDAFPERDNENKRVFQHAKMSVCIVNLCKERKADYDILLKIHDTKDVSVFRSIAVLNKKSIIELSPDNYVLPLMSQDEFEVFKQIKKVSNDLSTYGACLTGEVDITLGKEFISFNNSYPPLIRGAQVQQYYITNDISQGELFYLDVSLYLSKNSGEKAYHHEDERIVLQGITGVNEKNRIKATLLSPGNYCANSVNYLVLDNKEDNLFFLGVLNSSIINWYFKKFSTNSNVNGYEVNQLPIPKVVEQSAKDEIKQLVLKALNSSDSSERKAQKERIDELVQKLYCLDTTFDFN